MSVTVQDILSFPTMRGAEVIAGHSGLDNPVGAVTVLEYAVPGNMLEALYQSNRKYMGNELCITGFLSCPDDIEAQCYNLRRLAETGMAGLAIYYVGLFVKKISQELIDEANSLCFPLICMPRNRMDLRYADLISEAMELIVNDRQEDSNMAAEIISQLLHLPVHQRTVNTALHMLSNRLHTTLVLTNDNYLALDEVVWPRSGPSAAELITAENVPQFSSRVMEFPPLPGQVICKESISFHGGSDMWLFMLGETDSLRVSAVNAAAETIRLVVEIWSEHYSDLVRSEIVRAILQDEPIKMRQLARILNTDIDRIHSVWLFCPNETNEVFLPSVEEKLAELSGLYGVDGIVSLYKPTELVFAFVNSLPLTEFNAMGEAMVALLEESIPGGVTLTSYPYLENTAEVRRAYLSWCQSLPTIRTIQPRRKFFHVQDIEFAEQVRQILASGEEQTQAVLCVLERMKEESPLLQEMLTAYLLDAHSSMAECAELLHVHKNTVKYRLHKLENLLGFTIGEMPATAQLYLAAALQRLLTYRE